MSRKRVRWTATFRPDGSVHLEWRFAGTPRLLYLDRTRGSVDAPTAAAAKQCILDVMDALEREEGRGML